MLLQRQCILWWTITSLMSFSGNVESRVYFLRQPANITVIAGTKEAEIQCYVANYDGLVQWSKDGFSWISHSSVFPRYSRVPSKNPGEHNLRITNITIEDDGYYFCQTLSSQYKLKSRLAYVNVIVPPRDVTITPSISNIITVPNGHQINVGCIVNASKPRSSISWRVGGKSWKMSEENAVSKLPDSKLSSTSSVINLSPSKSDNGTLIECVVNQPASGTREVVRTVLNVVYPPTPPVISNPITQPLVAGKLLSLSCSSYDGNPLATLTWSIDGITLNSTSVQRQNKSTSMLRHVVRPQDHQKSIMCLAENSVTNKPLVTSLKLRVLYPPKMIHIEQSPEDPDENSTVSLKCWSDDSNPTATLSWFLNGVSISKRVGIHRIKKTSVSFGCYSETVLTLTNVKRNIRQNYYTCKASIPELSYANEVSKVINVRYPPLSVTVVSPAGYIFKTNQRLQLKCIAKGGFPAPTLKWYRDGRLLLSDQNIIILDNEKVPSCRNTDKTCSLLEMTVTRSENGARFECFAEHVSAGVSGKHGITLQVLFPPTTVAIEKFPITPVSGHKLSLTCITAPSIPEARISWFRNGASISPKHFSNLPVRRGEHGGLISSSLYRMVPTEDDYNSDIICKAENVELKQSVVDKVKLNVEFAPYVDKKTLEFNVTEGDKNVVLNIPVIANPENVTYRWWKLFPINPTSKVRHQSVKTGFISAKFRRIPVVSNDLIWWSRLEGALHFKSIQTADAGIYQVEVSNSRGVLQVNVTIDVLFAPRITSLKGPSIIKEGDDVAISCIVHSHPSVKLAVTWKKAVSNPRRVLRSVMINSTTSLLRFSNATSSDRGTYRCIAVNNIGKSEKPFLLRMKFGAEIDDLNTPRKVAMPESKSNRAALTCTAYGDPEVHFRWMNENGTIIHGGNQNSISYVSHDYNKYTSFLYISHDSILAGSNKYTCLAWNTEGNEQTVINLVPRGIPDPPSHLVFTDITSESITITWQPGFDGGVSQTFLLQYQLASKILDTQRWIQVNILSHKVTCKIDGLIPSTSYRFRMRSKNSYGLSDFTLYKEARTSNDPTSAGSSAGFQLGHIVVIAVSCAVIFGVMLALVIHFVRKRLTIFSYRPKSAAAGIDSLPTPDSSSSASPGTFPNQRRTNCSYLPSESEKGSLSKKKELGLATGKQRTGGSGQSLDHDMSRVSYTADGMSGGSEFSNSESRNNRRLYDIYPPSSAYTSLSSFGQGQKEGTLNRNQAAVEQMMYRNMQDNSHVLPLNHSDPRVTYSRRTESISSADCLLQYRENDLYQNYRQDSTSCAHDTKWDASCQQCRDEIRQGCALIRRGSEAIRHHTNTGVNGHRIYHTLSNTGRRPANLAFYEDLQKGNVMPMTAEPYMHRFQPRDQPFDDKANKNAFEDHYAQSHTSESSSGFRSCQNESPMDEPLLIPPRNEGIQTNGFHSLSPEDVSAMYGVNVLSLQQKTGDDRQGMQSNGLYVLGENEMRDICGINQTSSLPANHDNDFKHNFQESYAQIMSTSGQTSINSTSNVYHKNFNLDYDVTNDRFSSGLDYSSPHNIPLLTSTDCQDASSDGPAFSRYGNGRSSLASSASSTRHLIPARPPSGRDLNEQEIEMQSISTTDRAVIHV